MDRPTKRVNTTPEDYYATYYNNGFNACHDAFTPLVDELYEEIDRQKEVNEVLGEATYKQGEELKSGKTVTIMDLREWLKLWKEEKITMSRLQELINEKVGQQSGCSICGSKVDGHTCRGGEDGRTQPNH